MISKTENEELYIKKRISQVLAQSEVPIDFTEGLFSSDHANSCAQNSDCNRKDLTEVKCLTIDSAYAKELDDAVSLSVREDGYVLGVHIADVSAYVLQGSQLDQSATERGTTIYFPGYSVPMFPPEISHNLCSLTPDTDKRAVSVMIRYDLEGNLLSYEVCRSWIRSRVRGVYTEVEEVLEGTADERIRDKYEPVIDTIMNMSKLADLLCNKRSLDGADVSSRCDYKYRFNEGKLVLSITGNTAADRMICEFMVAANTCISDFFEKNDLPGFYRTQKVTGISARYSTSPKSHESLAVYKGYMRFTSPIRRATDYLIHQVLTSYLSGVTSEELMAKHLESFMTYCGKAQGLEDRARNLERQIVKECHLLYFARQKDDTFIGVIIGKNRRTEDSVIAIQPYGIRIFGSSMLSKFVGQEFLVSVKVDTGENCLRVGHISRITAA